MISQKIISVISGKGGTGKTLLTAVLADMLGNRGASILIVDLDIFVRGLTSLLFYYKQEALALSKEGELTVSDFFLNKNLSQTNRSVDIKQKDKLATSRYRSFDILPAVPSVDTLLDFNDISPDNRKAAEQIIKKILRQISKDYEIVIFDCRAGYDELIAAAHYLSDITISVEEDDVIARVTADNLVKQLQKVSQKTPLFRVTNKARNVKSEKDLDREIRKVTDLGSIPFDIDVMNSFGAHTFWDDISKTLYRTALARVWNRLNQKMELGLELPTYRFSAISSELLESRIGKLSFGERVFFVYGILMAIVGFTIVFIGYDRLRQVFLNPIEAVSLMIAFLGVFLTIYSVIKPGRKS